MSYPDKEQIITGVTEDDVKYAKNKARSKEKMIRNAEYARGWVNEYGWKEAKTKGEGFSNLATVGKNIQKVFPELCRWYYEPQGKWTPGKWLSEPQREEIARVLHWRIENIYERQRRHRKPSKYDNSVVYVVGDLERDVCKIGVSTDPESRLQSIQQNYPHDLMVLRLFYGEAQRLESRLHRRYQEHRKNGEWFSLCREIKDLVGKLQPMPIKVFSVANWIKENPRGGNLAPTVTT